MKNEISNKEWELAESVASTINDNISKYYTESVISESSKYVKAKVLVPMTENINMTFEIDVPYEMMDEDNSALLEYFKEHIYQMESEDYLTEMAKINPTLHKRIEDQKGFIYVSVPQGNEGPIPHMHIYHDKSLNKKKCTFLRLDEADYSPHHDILPLPDKLQEWFLRIMTDTWPKYNVTNPDGSVRYATGYEAAVDTWIDTHGLAKNIKFVRDIKTGALVMPPYQKFFKEK